MSKILIVDDEPEILEILETILAKGKHDVAKASDGVEAADLLGFATFDLVITDLKMPRMPGEKLIQQVRARPETRDCPILVVSSHLNAMVEASFRSIGRIHLMSKPFSSADLFDLVTKILGQHKPDDKVASVETWVTELKKAFARTVETFCGMQMSFGEPVKRRSGEPSGDISSVITIRGAHAVISLSLGFPKATFLALISRMLQCEFQAISEDNRDGAGELLNVVFGNVKAELSKRGEKLEMVIPSVVVGDGHVVSHGSSPNVLVIPAGIEGAGPCRIEILIP